MIYEKSQLEEVVEKLNPINYRLNHLETHGGEKWNTLEQLLPIWIFPNLHLESGERMV